MKLCAECGTSGHTYEEHDKIIRYWMDKITPKGRVSMADYQSESSWMNFSLPFPSKDLNIDVSDYISNSSVKGLNDLKQTYHFPDDFMVPDAFKKFGTFEAGPLTVESYKDEMEWKDVPIVCCMICDTECKWNDDIDGLWCPKCRYQRQGNLIYHKTVTRQVPKIYGIFDWHLGSKPLNP